MTASEAVIWTGIRRQRAGARFRRQVPIGSWIVDFASFDPKLVIEIDGASHDDRDETERTIDIEGRGFRILRFLNDDVLNNADLIVQFITDEVSRLRSS